MPPVQRPTPKPAVHAKPKPPPVPKARGSAGPRATATRSRGPAVSVRGAVHTPVGKHGVAEAAF